MQVHLCDHALANTSLLYKAVRLLGKNPILGRLACLVREPLTSPAYAPLPLLPPRCARDDRGGVSERLSPEPGVLAASGEAPSARGLEEGGGVDGEVEGAGRVCPRPAAGGGGRRGGIAAAAAGSKPAMRNCSWTACWSCAKSALACRSATSKALACAPGGGGLDFPPRGAAAAAK